MSYNLTNSFKDKREKGPFKCKFAYNILNKAPFNSYINNINKSLISISKFFYCFIIVLFESNTPTLILNLLKSYYSYSTLFAKIYFRHLLSKKII